VSWAHFKNYLIYALIAADIVGETKMVHFLANQYMCYCVLVGEERYTALRTKLEYTKHQQYRRVQFNADHVAADLYHVPREEFLKRVTLLEQIFEVVVPNPMSWYTRPLLKIWERIESAKQSGRRDVS
jgi:hypothetical protein